MNPLPHTKVVQMSSGTEIRANIREQMHAFLHYLKRSSEYSPQTVKSYGCDLRQFGQCLAAYFPDCSLGDVKPAQIQKYKESIAHVAPATVSRRLSALSTFFDWLWLHGEIEANPVAAIKRPRNKNKETKWVTPEDAVALLSACRDDRERAILATYLRAALRYSELMNLRLDDIDLIRDEMSVLGKGRVRRKIPILSDLRPYLVRWLAVRPGENHDYVFTTRTGHPLYEKACWRLFRSLLKRGGLEDRGYTVHSLRHGAATAMYEAGVDLGTIARFLRHEDATSVNRYVHAGTAVVRREIEGKLASLPDPRSEHNPGVSTADVEEAVRQAVTEALSELGLTASRQVPVGNK